MLNEETCREYLLRMTTAEADAAVEQAILDGTLTAARMEQIEDELIDEWLFNHLTAQEAKHFHADFLVSPVRREKLAFAAALQDYSAAQDRKASTRAPRWKRTEHWMTAGLAAGFACALLIVALLGERNAGLRADLERLARQSQAPSPALRAQSENSLPVMLLLTGETRRGLAPEPLLTLDPGQDLVCLGVVLPFPTAGNMHYELVDDQGRVLWAEDLATPSAAGSDRVEKIVLPAHVFRAADYRLRAFAEKGGERVGQATFVFRVRLAAPTGQR